MERFKAKKRKLKQKLKKINISDHNPKLPHKNLQNISSSKQINIIKTPSKQNKIFSKLASASAHSVDKLIGFISSTNIEPKIISNKLIENSIHLSKILKPTKLHKSENNLKNSTNKSNHKTNLVNTVSTLNKIVVPTNNHRMIDKIRKIRKNRKNKTLAKKKITIKKNSTKLIKTIKKKIKIYGNNMEKYTIDKPILNPLPESQIYGNWFEKLKNIFVITMRDERWVKARKRYKNINANIKKWKATDGRFLNKIDWKKRKLLDNIRMRRGQIGCYHSHMKIWQHIVNHNLPYALILEDDANLTNNKNQYKKILAAMSDLESIDSNWDIFFLSRSVYKTPVKTFLTSNIVIPGPSYGCFAYAVSLNAAKKLLEKCLPIKRSLDIYVSAIGENLKTYAMYPNLFFVVKVKSDTRNIK